LVSITRRQSSVAKLDHGLAELHAGVVHEDVDLDARRVQLVERADHCALVADVEGVRLDRVALAAQRGGRIGQPYRIDAIEHDSCASGGKALGDGKAQAARGTGDERGAARQVEELDGHGLCS
jgi:hypothetical protein